ncbi:MAG: hypothetical protein Q9157_002462 [Trypethelium eluteriae]
MVAIHTSSITITNVILNIYSSPRCGEFVESLREECTRVFRAHGGRWSKDAVNSLLRVDSAIRESMRLSEFSGLGIHRMVTAANGIDLGDGLHIPKGVRVSTPNHSIHRDPNIYYAPLEYDAFRFSRPREESIGASLRHSDLKTRSSRLVEQRGQALVTTSDTWLPFAKIPIPTSGGAMSLGNQPHGRTLLLGQNAPKDGAPWNRYEMDGTTALEEFPNGIECTQSSNQDMYSKLLLSSAQNVMDPDDPGLIPALKAPGDLKPDFIDPPTLMPLVVATSTVVLAIMTFFVSARFFIKSHITRQHYVEDWLSYLASAGVVASAGVFIYVGDRGLARHQWDITENTFENVLYYTNVLFCVYPPTMLAAKLSVLFQIKRIFTTVQKDLAYWAVVTSIVCNFIMYNFVWFSHLFQCWPREKIWNSDVEGHPEGRPSDITLNKRRAGTLNMNNPLNSMTKHIGPRNRMGTPRSTVSNEHLELHQYSSYPEIAKEEKLDLRQSPSKTESLKTTQMKHSIEISEHDDV